MSSLQKIPVGISACLIGNKVRYDGMAKTDAFCLNTLSKYFEYHALCPEVESGMSIPRPTIRLEQRDDRIIAVEPKQNIDYSQQIQEVFDQRNKDIDSLSGFIFTAKSPSCGVYRTKIYNSNGHIISHEGSGLFAEKLIQNKPLLPVEESGRLNDHPIRENFILRVYAYRHWQEVEKQLSKCNILDFYSQYKYTIMSQSPKHYKEIGKLLSNIKLTPISVLAQAFITLFMQGLAIKCSRKNHANTLMHIQGYFKKHLNSMEKHELQKVIFSYKQSEVPLIAPITLFKYFLKKYPNNYLNTQKYFSPYPKNLGLRNHI